MNLYGNIFSNYKKLSGNTKYTVNFFVMFAIPFNLFNFYFVLYMKDRGVTDAQIGYLMTITSVVSAVISIFSGSVLDRIGRKRFLFIVDCIMWPSVLILRIVADNFWLFAAAAVIGSAGVIGNIAFTFMISEDVPNEIRIIGFNMISIISLSSGMFVPIAGGLIEILGITAAERVLMSLGVISIIIMALWRRKFYVETPTGIKAMQKAREKGGSAGKHIFDRIAIMTMLKTPRAAIAAAAYILLNMFNVLASFSGSAYYLPYITERLGIDKSSASLLGGILSASLLFSSAVVIPAVSGRKIRSNITTGILLLILAMLAIVLTPPGGFTFLIVANIIFALGYTMLKPFVDTMLADSVDNVGRASVYAFLTFAWNITNGLIGLFIGHIYSFNAVFLYCGGAVILLILLCIVNLPVKMAEES